MNTELKVEIVGVSPLLMHNGQLADPLCPHVKAMRKITSKSAKSKTDADHEEASRIEFMGGLYIDKGGPIIPGELLEACIRDGARVERKGKDVVAGVWCDAAKLEYKGPRDPDKLWADKRFMDRRGAKIGKATVQRTRPKFRSWSASFVVNFDSRLVDKDVVVDAIHAGGRKGLGDYRPKFGRFDVITIK